MRKTKRAFYKNRTVLAAGVLSLLAVCGLAGVYRMETSKKGTEQELVNWEETGPEAKRSDESTGFDEKWHQNDAKQQSETDKSMKETETAVPELVGRDVEEEPGMTAEAGGEVPEPVDTASFETTAEHASAQASVSNAVNLDFQPDTGMLWPVEGNVILDYSMNQTIYFPTLDQYKYNPAIAIQSERETPVVAAASGVISSIVETDETGITMTMDLGNGYEAVYGQLANVSLGTGSYVEAGSQIGTVAEPSIYYQIEGDNLYFQVLKDGVAQDPLDYIR